MVKQDIDTEEVNQVNVLLPLRNKLIEQVIMREVDAFQAAVRSRHRRFGGPRRPSVASH